jgi:hypothetical protein
MEEYYVQGHKPRRHAGLYYVHSKIGYLDYVFRDFLQSLISYPGKFHLQKQQKIQFTNRIHKAL